MYSPTLGCFLTRDPAAAPGEPDLLYDNNWFGENLNRLAGGGATPGAMRQPPAPAEPRNLYAYVADSPVNFVDPTGLQKQKAENFYICKRLVEMEGCARACGCQHTNIYGDVSGEVYIGAGGGVAAPKGGGLPKGAKWKCYELNPCSTDPTALAAGVVINKTFRWGPKSGSACKGATSADILACLQAKPKPPFEPGLVVNCQTDVVEAASGCCLCTSFQPATLGALRPFVL